MDRINKASAVTRDQFHAMLRNWLLDNDDEDTIGNSDVGKQDWVWVKHLGNRYYLNSDTNGFGIGAYLILVDELGENGMTWTAVENERGRKNKAAFGPDQVVIPGFYFYRQV